MAEPPPAAYCGAPPAPAQLWSRWNLDPLLLIALAACLFVYLAGARRAGLGGARRGVFVAGWAAAALALTSPLCALSVALFSARVGQHMFLAAVAAPLWALGRPGEAVRALVRAGARATTPAWSASSLLASAAAFAVALWYWHTPAAYAVTFQSVAVYWMMHLSLFGSALWIWTALVEHGGARPAAAFGAVGLTGVQMSLLGAVLTFAPSPLYAPHLLTTAVWGLSPLEDQQLGGVLMWVPAGVIFTGALVWSLARLFARGERRAFGPSPA